jgi:beta-xylosidase
MNIPKRPYRICILIAVLLVAALPQLFAQSKSKVWTPDEGNGYYKNPVIHADYSDPDAIRVGNKFYMTASSFNHLPGLPLLESFDLVNWALVGHALPRLQPADHFSQVRHGGGVWAPSLRFHNDEFWIFYPDPDFGIYVIRSKNIKGPWSHPRLVLAGKGLIDPCPLWDEDGKVYLVHAYAGSRAGFKSVLAVRELNATADSVIGQPVMVYDGHGIDPTIEGPKLYKRNNWYYIFAPAGGVSTGWQLVLRSKSVYGPYERRIVMQQGNSEVNGPHQGAWVQTINGEDWFLHFQDKEAYGRVVHLQPMQWKNDWPVIGEDKDGDGIGEPVTRFSKPKMNPVKATLTPPDADEFNAATLGLQWQWQANPGEGWAFPSSSGYLRLFSVYSPDSIRNAWWLPNILAQKLPADSFVATVKLRFKGHHPGEQFTMIMLGKDYASLSLRKQNDGTEVWWQECANADKGQPEKTALLGKLKGEVAYMRIVMHGDQSFEMGYSEDGWNFTDAGKRVVSKPGMWVGAKMGMYFIRKNITNDAGYADVDWWHVEPLPGTVLR